MTDTKKPRRRIVADIKIEADSWDALEGHLRSLLTDMVIHERLPVSSISGGYSSGHIISVDEDETITHESWEVELEAFIKRLDEERTAQADSQPQV